MTVQLRAREQVNYYDIPLLHRSLLKRDISPNPQNLRQYIDEHMWSIINNLVAMTLSFALVMTLCFALAYRIVTYPSIEL